MVDRVKPLKMESPASGGTQLDDFPTALDKNQDYVDVRGVTIQDATSDDEAVRIEHASGDMVLRDEKIPVGKTLSELAQAGTGISEATHRTLRQLIHFVDEGPAPEPQYKPLPPPPPPDEEHGDDQP